MNPRHAIASACLSVALCAMLPAAATAATVTTNANAVGRCQPALPSYEGSVRKRPLAMQNEGSAAVFVTCAYIADAEDNSNLDFNYFNVYARVVNGTVVTLSCTAVHGWDTGFVYYSVKSTTLGPGAGQSSIVWSDADFPNGILSGFPISISCALPPGTGLNDLYLSYLDAND